jgi:K+-sensing histidine kinase KdpD
MARRWGFRLHTVIFVLALTAAALMLSVLMRPLLEPGFLPFFLAAVVLSAWFHGPVGGYSATFVSSILLIYFFHVMKCIVLIKTN